MYYTDCKLDFSDSPLPPSKVSLINANATHLVFSWNYTVICPSLHYTITSTNCGNCPLSTSSTVVACSNFPHSETCTFMVGVVICNENEPIFGNSSTPIAVNLRSNLVIFQLFGIAILFVKCLSFV